MVPDRATANTTVGASSAPRPTRGGGPCRCIERTLLRKSPPPCRAAAAAAATLLAAGAAQAFEIDLGNPDLALRWDNTVRYNHAVRVEKRDPKIGNSAIADEGTYSFDKGDAVAKRLDLLSELDFVYQRKHGFRVSAAAWADGAYGSKSRSNPNPPLVNIPS